MTSARRHLVAVAVVSSVLGLGSACGVMSTARGRDAVTPLPGSTGSARDTDSSALDSRPAPASSTGVGAPSRSARPTAPGSPTATSATFDQALASYCTAFYTQQRDNEDRYPSPASAISFSQAQVVTSQSLQVQLTRLQPPPALRGSFAAFVANAQQILSDRVAELHDIEATGGNDAVGSRLDADFAARWPLAAQLGASGCDGQLPADQQVAVVDAIRTFETSPDSVAVCRDLVTPSFLVINWPQDDDRQAGCVSEREAIRLSTNGLPLDIEIQKITGVEGIAATAHYTLTDRCGCATANTTRLHFVDGGWRVTGREK